MARHPESRVLLDAARASRDVLQDHARSIRSRSAPDLWPSVRAELARTGAFAPAAAAPGAAAPGARALGGPSGKVLGGAAWFRRRSVAMAAAVLLVTSVGLMVSRGGGAGLEPSGSPATPTAFTGGSADVRLVGSPARRAVPLRRPGAAAVHLIDQAPAGALWQAGAVPAVEVVPLDQAGAALAGGR